MPKVRGGKKGGGSREEIVSDAVPSSSRERLYTSDLGIIKTRNRNYQRPVVQYPNSTSSSEASHTNSESQEFIELNSESQEFIKLLHHVMNEEREARVRAQAELLHTLRTEMSQLREESGDLSVPPTPSLPMPIASYLTILFQLQWNSLHPTSQGTGKNMSDVAIVG